MSSEIININPNADYLPKLNMLMVEMSETANGLQLFGEKGQIYHYAKAKESQIKLVNWGVYNNFPQLVDKLIYEDADAPVIIQNKVNFLMGQGLEPFRIKVVDGKKQIDPVIDENILDWLENNEDELHELLRGIAKNYELYGNFFIEFITNRAGQVVSARNIDCHNVRPVRKGNKDLYVKAYGIKIEEDNHISNYEIFPSYKAVKQNLRNKKFIYQGKDAMPGNDYFSAPIWLGAWKNLQLSKMVLEGQISALENGWNIKYKLSVHSQYYADCATDAEKKLKKQALVDELNKVLSGHRNTNKTLVVEMVGDYANKQFNDLVKIEEIDNNKENQMLTKLLESKNIAAPRSFNIDPELSGIIVGSNMSSGSEIRNKYNVHILLKTPIPRKILLQPIKLISDSFGWKVRWRITDAVLTTTDKNQDGFEEKE